MPERTYQLNYKGDNSDLVAKTKELEAVLRSLDATVTSLAPKIRGYASGSGTPVSAASKAAQNLGSQLAVVESKASAAQIALAGVGPAAIQAQGSLMGVSVASTRASATTGKLTNNIQGLGLGLTALQAGRVIVEGIAEALKNARDYAREGAEANLKYKDSLRETANLSDKDKPDQAVAAGQIDLMLQTGFKPEEARKFSNEFKGSIYAARTKGNIAPTSGSPEQLEREMEIIAARTAAAKQVDPGSMANLVSSIAITGPVRNKEQIGAEISLSIDAMNEGIGSLSAMTRQVLSARGSMIASGYAQSVPDVAAIVSGMSINNPVGRTATRIESMVSSVSKATSGEGKEELAKIGITNETRDFVEVLRKLKPVIDKANEPGGGGAISALRNLGITEARPIQEFIKSAQELPIYEKLIAKNRETLGDPSQKIKADPARITAASQKLTGGLDKFQQADSTGKFADAELFAANFLRGSQSEKLTVQRRSAAAKLIADEKIKTAPAELEGLLTTGFGLQSKFGGKTAEEMKIDQLVAQRLMARAKQAGMSVEQVTKMTPDIPTVAAGGGSILGDSRLGAEVELMEARLSGDKSGGPVIRDMMARQKGQDIRARIKGMATEGDGAVKAAGAVAGPGGDPEANRLRAEQLRVLQGIERKLDGGGGGGAGGLGPMGPAILPGGANRIGE